jgi:hypothetical protein
MNSNEEKRLEYWNHFVARYFVEKVGGGNGVTGSRLMKIQSSILADDHFWLDVISRHNGLNRTPEQMRRDSKENYNHCLGNFWGMINQEMVMRGMIK